MRTTIGILVLALIASRMSHAQWTRASVPYGGTVRCLEVSGSTILAATNVGLLRSTDNGEVWERSGLTGTWWTGLIINALASSGTRCFVGTYTDDSDPPGGGVWCSTDEGVTWRAASNGLPDCPVNALAAGIAYGGGTNLFAALRSSVFRSADNGEHWDSLATIDQSGIVALDVVPDGHGGSCVLVGTHSGGIFASTDEGESWAPADSGIPHVSDPSWPEGKAWAFSGIPDGRGGTMLFAGLDPYGVYRSTDMGRSWTAANAGLPVSAVDNSLGVRSLSVLYDADGNAVLLAGTSPVYRSTDNGNSWTVGSGVTDGFVWSMAVSKNGTNKATILVGTSGLGIFRSTDKGISWEVSNKGLFGTTVLSTAVRGTTVFAGTEMVGPFRSTDYGTSWTAASTGMPNVDVYSIVVSGSHLMAITSSGLFSSDNDAARWTPQNGNVSAVGARENLFLKSIKGSGLFISSDCGLTWANAGLSDVVVTSLCFGDSSIFAAAYPPNPWASSRVYSSSDQGKTWTYANTFPANGPIWFLQWCRSSDGLCKYLFAGGGGVFRSTDDGLTWAATNNGLTYTGLSAFAIGGNCLFAGILGPGGVFVSTDYGEHWESANAGLSTPYPHINSFALITDSDSAPTILAPVSGSSEMWRASLKDLVTSLPGLTAIVPKEFLLNQNYPNPFNPSTTIKYELPKTTQVTLIVYDILGRQVSVLVNEKREAGVHEVKFDGSNLASGVYLYRLQAGKFVEAKKFVVLK